MKIKVLSFDKEHFDRKYLKSLTEVELIETVLRVPCHTFSYDYASVTELVSDLNDKVINTDNNWLLCIEN